MATKNKERLQRNNDELMECIGLVGPGGGGGSRPNVNEKDVTPTFQEQIVVPDAGYDYLSRVTVKPIPCVKTNNAAGGITVTIG